VLAEDDVLLREGLASLLERSDYEVVGRAVTGLDVRWLTGSVPASRPGCRPGGTQPSMNEAR
jgi:DNA-binding NarL/FixJ family response regulator